MPVVGAWTWLPELSIGVTTEVDVAEAYRTLRQIEAGFWMLFGMFVLAAGGMFAYSLFVVRLRRRMRKVQRLGQYRLQKKIGEGGMGKVYLAKHALLRRPTAIKLLNSEGANKQHITRFEREVQFTAQLTHPNTIAIYDYGRTPDGVFYYAMEYLQGISLNQVVAEAGPLPPGRVIHILVQASGSLAEAHAAGLIHRDVKPANLILGERGGVYDFVKVLDFGLVREINQSESVAVTQVDTITGTPLYLSPEQINAPDTLDGRSDLYALGAVGYFLLTGEVVFSGANVVDIFRQHLSEAPQSPSERLGRELPADLEAVILQCLAKDRNERPASAAVLAEALQACESAGTWSARDAQTWWEARTETRAERPGDPATPTPSSRSEPPTFEVDLERRLRSKPSVD